MGSIVDEENPPLGRPDQPAAHYEKARIPQPGEAVDSGPTGLPSSLPDAVDGDVHRAQSERC